MKQKHRLTVLTLAAAPAILAPGPRLGGSALLAQSASSPVCLTSSPPAAAPLTVMVPKAHQAELEAAGFVAMACAGKELEVAQYQADICKLASGLPMNAQQQFASAYSVSPSRLCSMAGEL